MVATSLTWQNIKLERLWNIFHEIQNSALFAISPSWRRQPFCYINTHYVLSALSLKLTEIETSNESPWRLDKIIQIPILSSDIGYIR